MNVYEADIERKQKKRKKSARLERSYNSDEDMLIFQKNATLKIKFVG